MIEDELEAGITLRERALGNEYPSIHTVPDLPLATVLQRRNERIAFAAGWDQAVTEQTRVLNRSPALREMFDEGGLEKVLDCGYLNAIADIQSGDDTGPHSPIIRQMHHACRALTHLCAALYPEETE